MEDRLEQLLTKLRKKKLWTSKEADTAFSMLIRIRDKRCFFCNNEGSQCSHFWGRGHSATRYDPLNADSACGGCHMRHEGSKQGLYREMKIQQLGQDKYESLERRARSIVPRRDAIIACMKLFEVV